MNQGKNWYISHDFTVWEKMCDDFCNNCSKFVAHFSLFMLHYDDKKFIII